MEDDFGKVRFVETSYLTDCDLGDVDEGALGEVTQSARQWLIVDLEADSTIDYKKEVEKVIGPNSLGRRDWQP